MVRYCIKFLVFALICFLSFLTAKVEGGDEILIKEIKIEGNRFIRDDEILEKLKIEVGKRYSKQKLRESLRELYSMDYFKDIHFVVEEEKEGVRLICVVVEKPVMEVEFIGNRFLNVYELERELVRLGKDARLFYSPEAIDWYKTALINIYKNRGFYFVNITTNIQLEEEKNTARVIFEIIEGKPVRVKNINFSGNNFFDTNRLKKEMVTTERKFFADNTFRENFWDADIEKIQSLYKRYGYLKARVKGEVIPDKNKKYVTLNIKIIEGPRYRVRHIYVQGASLLKEEKIKDGMALKEGDFANTDRYKSDIETLQGYYAERGYLEAMVRPEIKFYDEKSEIDFIIHVDEGPLLYVDRVLIEGRKKTKEDVIQREILLKKGDILNGRKIMESKINLERLGYLGKVNVFIEPGERKDTRNVVISIDDPGGTETFEAGYNYYTNLYGSTFYLKAKDKNLFGRGQTIEADIEIGSNKKEYLVNFEEPWLFNRPISLVTSLYDTSTDSGYFRLRRQGGSVSLSRVLMPYTRGQFIYTYEFNKAYSFNPAEESLDTGELVGSFSQAKVGLGIERDTRDSRFFTTSGSVFHIGVDTGSRLFGGENEYLRVISELGWYRQLWNQPVVFLRVRGGIVTKLRGGDYIPIYERFFVGGASTVRGYDYGVLGSRFGNLAMLVGNVEWRYKVMKNLYAALFYDLGYGWKRVHEVNLGDLKQGIGAGLVLESPMATVRIDYGHPLSHTSGGDQIYLTFGGDF